MNRFVILNVDGNIAILSQVYIVVVPGRRNMRMQINVVIFQYVLKKNMCIRIMSNLSTIVISIPRICTILVDIPLYKFNAANYKVTSKYSSTTIFMYHRKFGRI